MRNYYCVIACDFEAETAEEAADQMREYLNSNRLDVEVQELDETGTPNPNTAEWWRV